jgi:hypothetical protein
MERSWNGDDLVVKSRRAAGRAIIGIGMQVSVETKRLTHVVEGTLRRSIHAAPAGYDGADDEVRAESADLMSGGNMPEASYRAEGAVIEVGSWLPYACVEWIGRGHPGITQGLESVRGSMADSIVRAAYRQEGLA